MKIKGYKDFDGCPKCGGYDYESWIDGFDFLDLEEQYIAVHHVVTCDCGHHFRFDEIYKYECDLIKEREGIK